MLANTSPGPESRQRMSGEERRALIVETAYDLFAQNGFRGTTTREVASAVGVSEPVLYQHFANKRELYTAIVDHMVEQSIHAYEDRLEAILSETTEEGLFQKLGELVLGWYLDDPRNIRLLLFSALEGHELADLWHERAMAVFFAPIEEAVLRRAEQGRLKSMEPTVATRAFIGMVAHFGLVTVLFKDNEIPVSRTELIGRFVEIFLHGARR